MENTKFVGMDVHKDAITIAVMNSAGKVITSGLISADLPACRIFDVTERF